MKILIILSVIIGLLLVTVNGQLRPSSMVLDFDVSVGGGRPTSYKLVCNDPHYQPHHPMNGQACQEIQGVVRNAKSKNQKFTAALHAAFGQVPQHSGRLPPCNIGAVHVTIRDAKVSGMSVSREEIQRSGKFNFVNGCRMKSVTSQAGLPHLFPL